MLELSVEKFQSRELQRGKTDKLKNTYQMITPTWCNGYIGR